MSRKFVKVFGSLSNIVKVFEGKESLWKYLEVYEGICLC